MIRCRFLSVLSCVLSASIDHAIVPFLVSLAYLAKWQDTLWDRTP